MRSTIHAVVAVISLYVGPAFAITEHSFVAVSGAADAGDCPRTQPCATINYAGGRTLPGGVITILDEGEFDAVSVSTHVTVEGQGPGTRIWNGMSAAGVTQVDTSGRLVLRNLLIGTAFNAPGKIGVRFSGASLRLENVTISNQVSSDGAIGVYFKPLGNAVLELRNVTVENTGNQANGGAVVIDTTANTTSRIEISDSSLDYISNGIVIKGQGNVQLAISNTTIAHANKDGIFVNSSAGTTRLTVQNSKVVNHLGNGLTIAPTGAAKVNTTVIGSIFEGNVIGIRSFPGGSAVSNVTISDTSTSNNAGGIHASGKSVVSIIRAAIGGNSSYGVGALSPAAVRIGSSVVSGNTLGFTGPISSYGNNQLHGNTNVGSTSPLPPGSVP